MSSSVSKMRVITTIAEAQAQPYAKRRVLVPTMGALHKAHGEMVRVATQTCWPRWRGGIEHIR